MSTLQYVVDTLGEFVQAPTVAAEVVFENAQIESPQSPLPSLFQVSLASLP